MQAAKVKPGEIYALQRSGKLARFKATAVITHRTDRKTSNSIEGYVLEERVPDAPVNFISVPVDELLGPYEEYAELAARKAQEQAEAEARDAERHRLACVDRLALYAFVGMPPPKSLDDYTQPFRVRFGTVSIDSSGQALIVSKIHELQDPTKQLRLVSSNKE